LFQVNTCNKGLLQSLRSFAMTFPENVKTLREFSILLDISDKVRYLYLSNKSTHYQQSLLLLSFETRFTPLTHT
jgi:hypothetical protein